MIVRAASVLSRRPAHPSCTTICIPTTSRTTLRRASAPYSTSHVSDDDPQVLEEEKKRNLSKGRGVENTMYDFAPGWNELLASNSEANLKADKASGTTLEFQAKSIKFVKEHYPQDDHHSNPDRAHKVEAEYEKDEISGPLKGAQPPETHETMQGPLSTSHGKEEVNQGNTASEDAVKADRGEN